MRPGDRRRQAGFTYIALLWWVAISGVLLAALGQQWKLEARRQRELEMVFRAEQIQEALLRYQAATPPGQQPHPERLADLLEDRRGPQVRRHLRQLWNDPITRQPWGLLLAEGRIRGVHSLSDAVPVKAPDGVTMYSEWLFEVPVMQASPPESGASAPGQGPGTVP